MTADAVVVAASADGRIDLEFAPIKPCASCAGTCLWKRLQSSRIESLAAGSAFAPGTEVTVSLPDRRVLSTAILLHGLPLLAILLGAALGAAIAGTDLGTLIGVVLAVAIVLLLFGRWRRRFEQWTLNSLQIQPK